MKLQVVILLDSKAFGSPIMDVDLEHVAEKERLWIAADAIGGATAMALEESCPKSLARIFRARWLIRAMSSISVNFAKEDKPNAEVLRNSMPSIRASVGDWRKFLAGQNYTPAAGANPPVLRKQVVYGRPGEAKPGSPGDMAS